MAAIFRKVILEYQGKEYTITPTMRLINDIEQDISLSRLAQRLATGDPPLSHVATVVACLLRGAGAKCTDEEVYQELMTGDVQAVRAMAGAVIEAVFPESKKADAPAQKKAPRKK